MTTEIDDFRTSLVAAVQAELERHASAVVAEVDRLRDEGRRERAELRDDLTAQVNRLAESAAANSAAEQVTALEQRFEAKLAETEQRQTRRLDDVTSSIDGLVTEATRPVVTDLRNDYEALTVRTPLLPSLSDRAAAALALVFWLPATIGFFAAVPAMLDLLFGQLAWSAVLVVAAVISSAGIVLFGGIWPGGEARLRALHIFLALGMNAIILVTQLLLGWPES